MLFSRNNSLAFSVVIIDVRAYSYNIIQVVITVTMCVKSLKEEKVLTGTIRITE